MKVGELLEAAQTDIQNKKEEKARNILIQKMMDIERTEKILADMKADLEAFKDADVADMDICTCRY